MEGVLLMVFRIYSITLYSTYFYRLGPCIMHYSFIVDNKCHKKHYVGIFFSVPLFVIT